MSDGQSKHVTILFKCLTGADNIFWGGILTGMEGTCPLTFQNSAFTHKYLSSPLTVQASVITMK